MTDGWIRFYLNESDLLISAKVSDYFPPKFIAFSRSAFEESSRIFFDCPEKNEPVLEDHSTTVRSEHKEEFVGELREGIDYISEGSLVFTGRYVFLFIMFWICKGF